VNLATLQKRQVGLSGKGVALIFRESRIKATLMPFVANTLS
jgi:hypothetical protein